MTTLHLLGTGAAMSDPHRTTTMLALSQHSSVVLIDCGGDVVQRVMAAGLELDHLAALIVTHEHADHVSGFPLFMEKIWLAGRRRPIPVHGIAPALSQARRLWESFDTESWEGVPEIQWREVPYEASATVLADDRWQITASPVDHAKPTVGLRVVDSSGAVLAYSSDTAPTESVVALADRADLLVHEATGDGPGHSDAVEAAEIARRANAKRLVLVHLPPAEQLDDEMMARARGIFEPLTLGVEGGSYTL